MTALHTVVLLSPSSRATSLVDIPVLCSDRMRSRDSVAVVVARGGGGGKCGCVTVYEFKSRKIFKCTGCASQFSLTSGTIFASRKLSIRDILAAMPVFGRPCVSQRKPPHFKIFRFPVL